MTADPPLAPGLTAGWRDALARDLGGEGLRVVEPATPGSAHVSIRVEVETGVGRTATGRSFRVARARATLRVLRASVRVDGRPCVGTDPESADELAARSLESILPRVVAALSW